jgi:hypothetical protein
MARVYHPVNGYTGTVQLSRLFDPAVHCLIGAGPSSYIPGERYRIRVLLSYLSESGSNARIRSLDYHPAQLYISDMGNNTAEFTKDVSIPRTMNVTWTTPKVLRTKVYYATWSRSFTASGATRYDDSQYCYHGYYDSTNGNQKSMIGFSSQIAADLTGASVRSCNLTLKNVHTGTYAGINNLSIGTHANASKPSTWTGASSPIVTGLDAAQGATKTFSLGTTFAERFKTGAAFGVTLGPPSTTSLTDYGYFAGAGMSSRPYLTITYLK